MVNDRGMVKNIEEVIALMKKYPQGALFLVLRNFNKLGDITTVGVQDIPEGVSEYKHERRRAYANCVSVTEGFFPEEIVAMLKRIENEDGHVSISRFLNLGQKIANITGRKLIIIHQYGSGDQSQAEFDEYYFLPMKKIIIVGAGHVLVYHLAAIRELFPETEVVVTDIDAGKANSPEISKFGVQFVPHSGWHAEMEKSDLVVVCVPCAEHFAIAKEALEAGKVVLLEKPPTKTVAQLEELQAISRRVPGAQLICAFHAAYDLTIEHFATQMENGVHSKYGELVGVRAEFSDPYVQDGLVTKSMGGSWEDSASNALSVVGRFLDLVNLSLNSALITNDVPAAPGYACIDSEARVSYMFPDGKIEIRTDWVTGRNRKVTYLFFELNTTVMLHHSEQTIYVGVSDPDEHDGWDEVVSCDNGRARLDNHYIGVYRDLMKMVANNTDNTDLGLQITKLWIAAYEKAGIEI